MALFNPKDIVSAIRQTLNNHADTLPLHQPRFMGNEWQYLKNCLDSGWVSSVGEYVSQFEEKLAQYTGAQYAIAVVNGTAALHTCLNLIGVQPNDEVLCPALTFVATANAINYCHAIPHFVDASFTTLGIDTAKLVEYLDKNSVVNNKTCFNSNTGRPIRALIAMHTYGHPVEIDRLQEICASFCITLVEDAAESLGSQYNNQHTGTFGTVSALSFNGNKIMTSGGGGAILTNDKHLALRAKHITTTAKTAHPWELNHDELGYNYRLPNINAALGLAQLEQLDGFVQCKRQLAIHYQQAFQNMPGVTVFNEPPNAYSNYWLNILLLDADLATKRDRLLGALHDNHILSRPAWQLMHRLPMYCECPCMTLKNAEQLYQRIICLPSSVKELELELEQ